MDRSILEQYQNRIEQIPNKLEQNQTELQERIAREQTELQERIAREQTELQERVVREQTELQERIVRGQTELQERMSSELNKLQQSMTQEVSNLDQIISGNQERLTQLDGPIDMSDLRYTSDFRDEPRQYADDDEGRLLREYSIARTTSGVTRAELEQIEGALRKLRENKRDAEKAQLQAEIESAQARKEEITAQAQTKREELETQLSEEQQRLAAELSEEQAKLIAELSEGQGALTAELNGEKQRLESELAQGQRQNEAQAKQEKTQVIAELQKMQEETKKEIADAEKQRQEIMNKKEETKRALEAAQAAMSLKDLPVSAYKATVKARKDCLDRKIRQEADLKRLDEKIAELQQDFEQLGTFLNEIDVKKGKGLEEEEDIRARYDEALEQFSEQLGREEAQGVDYDAIIEDVVPEEEQEEPTPQPAPAPKPGPKPTPQPKPAPAPKPGSTPAPQPKQAPAPKTSPTPQTKQAPAPKPGSTSQPKPKCTIGTVGVYFRDDGKPVYYATVLDEKGNIVENLENIGFENVITKLSPELEIELNRRVITNPGRYYDTGLANLLEIVDKKYQTQAQEAYIKLLQDKNSIGKKHIPIDIDYDFSNLRGMPESKEDANKLKYLKNIANTNYKAMLATYEKQPHEIIARIKNFFSSRKTKLLPEGQNNIKQPASAKPVNAQPVAVPTKEITPEEVMMVYEELSKYPEFDITSFIATYHLSKEEAEKYGRKYKEDEIARIAKEQEGPQKKKRKPNKFKEGLAIQLEKAFDKKETFCSQYRHLYKDGFDVNQIKGLNKGQRVALQEDFEKWKFTQKEAFCKGYRHLYKEEFDFAILIEHYLEKYGEEYD